MRSIAESDLIAYHLHELSPAKERAVRSALKLNPELAAQSEAIAATLRMFDPPKEIPIVNAAVLDRNWRGIRSSLEVLQPRPRLVPWRRFAVAGAALALATCVGLYLWRQNNTTEMTTPHSAGTVQHPASSSGSANGSDTASRYPTDRGDITTSSRNTFAPILTSAGGPAVFLPHEIGSFVPPDEPIQLGLLQELPLVGPPTTSPGVRQTPQSPTPTTPSAPGARKKTREADFSIGVFGDLTATRSPGYTTGSGTTLNSESRSQAAVPAAGVLATFHQQLRPSLGYSVSAGYTHTTFNYTYGASNSFAGFFERGGIGTNIFELSSAYVVQGPRSKRASSFADVGGGILTFLPTTSTQNTSYVFRPTGVAGAGINYKLTPHLALRAEYRGLYFKGPDFRYTNGTIPVTTRYTLSSEPTVGLTYQFGKTSK